MTGTQDPYVAPGGGAGGGAGGPDLTKQTPPGYGSPPGYGPPSGYGYGAPGGYGTPGGQRAAGGAPVLANWGTRVGAFLLDGLLVLGIMILSVVVGVVLSTISNVLGNLVIVGGYLGAIAFLFWQLVVQGRTGQTIGKKQLGIKLLREQDGQVVGGGLSVGRHFVHFLDALPFYLGFLWPLWDDKKQTFADKLLQTVVVKV